MTSRRPAYIAVAVLILGCAACNREAAPVASVDHAAACADPAAAAQIKAMLLRSDEAGGKLYRRRVRGARLNLSEPVLLRYDDQTGRADCTATAQLSSAVIVDEAQASQALAFTVALGDRGGLTVSHLISTDGGDLRRFAGLLKPARLAAAPPPLPVAAPPDPPPGMDPTAADAAGPPPPTLSAESRELLDQAGDTRAARVKAADPDTATPPPATP